MSQYLQESAQRIYQSNYQYSLPQNNFFVQPSQRNMPIRQASLNRNSSISSSMVLKPGKIQQNNGAKLRRQNSLKNCVDFKENDPFAKNSSITNHIHKLNANIKNSSDYVSEYDPKNSYCNPLIVKRDKLVKDMSRQQIPSYSQTRQTSSEKLKNSLNLKDSFSRQQYEQLNQKMIKMQNSIRNNTESLSEHKFKIQKLEQMYQHQIGKVEHNRKHSRSISVSSSAPTGFKQLSDIMKLIEETKNYQIKNSDEYRKMIEQFRSTILQFRDQLNSTIKRQDFDMQILKVKEVLTSSNGNPLKRSTIQLSTSQSYGCKSKQIQSIEKQINLMKSSIQRLDESSMSLKADIVKFNVRDKKSVDQIQSNIFEFNRKLQNLQKSIEPFSEYKRGYKYEGSPICFKVNQQLYNKLVQSQKGSYEQHKLIHSSVVQYKQGMNLIPNNEKIGLTIKQKIYFIDKDGYLLDKDNYYLVNDRNEQIRLSQKQVSVLKKFKVMQ